MKHRGFLNSQHSATFASPATPPSHQEPKGWSSERVPHTQSSSRNVNAASTMFPFSSGRTLPSKWDDAERWICSPVFGHEGGYGSKKIESNRRAKSKSGPLGPQAPGNYGNYSPLMPSSTAVDSPFLGRSGNNSFGGGRRRSCPGQTDQDVACTREWLKLLNQPTDPEFEYQEEEGAMEEAEIQVTRVFSRRDMGTQMVPSDGSSSSSSSFSSPPPEDDEVVKEVKVDREDTFPSSRKLRDQSPEQSRLEIEEAKINEWEDRQREKAEAAIRKLEKKLEKKRTNSMEKIMKKLERAEGKAGKMRASLSESRRRKVVGKISRWIGLMCRRSCAAD